MPELNARARQVPISPTMAAASAQTLHPDPIDLAAGEPLDPPPSSVIEAGRRALADGRVRYGEVPGDPELREAIAESRSVRPEEVIVTAGGKAALIDALRVLLEPGDEVVIPAPAWPSFGQQVAWIGANAIEVPPTDDARVDWEATELACGPRTRAIIVNSPLNPTADVHSEAELRRVLELARRWDAWVISDEVYRHLAFERPAPSVLELVPDLDGVVIVDSFSKRFSLTGLRVGAAIAQAPVIDALVRIASASTTHPATVSQAAALATFEVDPAWERERLDRDQHRSERAYARILDLPLVTTRRPEAALFLFLDVRPLLEATGVPHDRALVDRLREEIGLSLVPGAAFGTPGFIRVSAGVEEDRLDEAFDRWAEWIAKERKS